MYPPIEPHHAGMLPVGDCHEIYYEVCGNPEGIPVLVLHGGPGTGCNVGMRRLFDPQAYRIVLFDQRGCGRSLPHASDISVSLEHNTTANLLADISLLLDHLGTESTLSWGGSWGCTLALAYALDNRERVLGMILTGVTTTRRSEIDWLYRGVAPLFPAEWQRFIGSVPQHLHKESMPQVFAELLQSPDEAVRNSAAIEWCAWESALISTHPDYRPSPRWSNPEFSMAFARIVTHYFSQGAWLREGELLERAHSLQALPGILIHGRLDLDAPLTTAFELAQAWPGAELVVVHGAGHAGTDPGMMEAVISATDRFRTLKHVS